MNRNGSREGARSGFTIVELLIVIVVIAILASIAVVAFSGIQKRAKVSAAKADLANIGKQMQLYYADHGRYPSTLQVPRTDIANILKAAGLYEVTRASSQEAWAAGERPAKRFVFCTPEGDTQRYAVVVDFPILADTFEMVGETTYFIDHTGVIQEMIFTESYPGIIARSLCVNATGVNPDVWEMWTIWSNSVPEPWAE